jgi:2'-5' RNA ligase
LRVTAIRRQLSLYASGDAARDIEAVRKRVDPTQHRLIPAHVTLCREDELGNLPSLKERLSRLSWPPLRLRFGRAEAFSGHGLLLPCIGGEEGFHRLREHLLMSTDIRLQKPHLTLAHPRNPKAGGNSMANAASLAAEIEIRFPAIHLIEQEEGQAWKVLEHYRLSC